MAPRTAIERNPAPAQPSLEPLFALLRAATGSFDFRPLGAGQAGLGLRTAIFVTALIGFGFKAGMMPFHFWLPSAHANA